MMHIDSIYKMILIYKLTERSDKWQMLFNLGKCKCLHIGHGNEDEQYTLGGTVLNTTSK